MARRRELFVAACTTLAAVATGTYQMKPVRTIHARVSGDAPEWDATHDAYVASFGDSFDAKFRANLDTVNTASVEGALMYVQAEGINQNEQSVKCERKNKMKYVVFYEISIVQPPSAMAYYSSASAHVLPEYCPFVALDSGKCTPEGPGDKLPEACDVILGQNGKPKGGPCVGGEPRETDPRAPYPDTVWFSFPNSCLTKIWKDKTEACRKEQPGGLCPVGTKPDGVTCSFASTVLGYVTIDDVVGITSINKADGSTYSNFTEFCLDGNVEFKATGQVVEEALPFWKNPFDAKANVQRAKKLVDVYNKKLTETMKPLPSVEELTAENPPCYENSPMCANAALGCRRHLYSQVCEVCKSGDTAGCVKAPSSFTFPAFPKLNMTSVDSNTKNTTTSKPNSSKNTTSVDNSSKNTMLVDSKNATTSKPSSKKDTSKSGGSDRMSESALSTKDTIRASSNSDTHEWKEAPTSYDFTELDQSSTTPKSAAKANKPTNKTTNTTIKAEAASNKEGFSAAPSRQAPAMLAITIALAVAAEMATAR